jgi:hypothetical protein
LFVAGAIYLRLKAGRGLYRVRFSFPGATADVEAAMRRFVKWWPGWKAEVHKARETRAIAKNAV